MLVFPLSLWLYLGLLFTGQSFGDVMHPAWFINQPWINTNIGAFHFQVNYALGTDGLSMPMIILNGLLTFLAIIGSWQHRETPSSTMALLLFLETGVMGVFASFDLFLFILFWEVELIPMFLLIGIWGGQRREYAAWKFLIYTLVGSSFTLAGIFMIYVQTGTTARRFQFFASAGATDHRDPAAPWGIHLAATGSLLAALRRIRGQDTHVAGAYLAARRPYRGANRRQCAPGRRAAEDGRVRI